MRPVHARETSAARALIGLGVLGWGLAILVRVAPHEDPVVGAGLLILGIGLVATAPKWPSVERMSPLLPAALGAAALLSVATYNALRNAPMDLTKWTIIVYGAVLLASAPFLQRTLVVRSGQGVRVATLVACSFAAVGAPLAVWAIQASFEGLTGTTPIEVFVQFALLLPLAAVLGWAGWEPKVDGQVLSYATPAGPLRVEVGAACSGVQAMALFGAVLALYLWFERPTGRRFALWAFVGMAGLYVANLLRLCALMVVGYHWGSEALLTAHEQAGWIFFVAWAVLFAYLARRRGTPATAVAVPALRRGKTFAAMPTDASSASRAGPQGAPAAPGSEAPSRSPL